MSAEHPLKEGPFSGAVLDRSVWKVLREQGVFRPGHVPTEGRDVPCIGEDRDEHSFCGNAGKAWVESARSVSALSTGTGNLPRCIADAMNAIFAAGAEPCAISLSITMPYPAAEETLREIIRSAGAQCAMLSVAIETVTGRADPAVTKPVFTVSAVGRSMRQSETASCETPRELSKSPGEARSLQKAHAVSFKGESGQVMLMAGCTGESGARELIRENRETLARRFSKSFLHGALGHPFPKGAAQSDTYSRQGSELSIREIAGIAAGAGAQIWSLGEGGVLRGLWLFLEQLHAGFAGDMRSIPIRQETVEVCEALGENPYTLYSGGSALLVTRCPEELLSRFWEKHIPASVIGSLTKDRARVMTNGGEIRYLERF